MFLVGCCNQTWPTCRVLHEDLRVLCGVFKIAFIETQKCKLLNLNMSVWFVPSQSHMLSLRLDPEWIYVLVLVQSRFVLLMSSVHLSVFSSSCFLSVAWFHVFQDELLWSRMLQSPGGPYSRVIYWVTIVCSLSVGGPPTFNPPSFLIPIIRLMGVMLSGCIKVKVIYGVKTRRPSVSYWFKLWILTYSQSVSCYRTSTY